MVCGRLTDLAAALPKGIVPLFNLPALPHPLQCHWSQKIPVSWFSALKPWRTNLIFLAAAATG